MPGWQWQHYQTANDGRTEIHISYVSETIELTEALQRKSMNNNEHTNTPAS